MSSESKARRLALTRPLTAPEREAIVRARHARRRQRIMGNGDLSAQPGNTGRGISLECVDPTWHRRVRIDNHIAPTTGDG